MEIDFNDHSFILNETLLLLHYHPIYGVAYFMLNLKFVLNAYDNDLFTLNTKQVTSYTDEQKQ